MKRLEYIIYIVLLMLIVVACEKTEKKFPFDVDFMIDPANPKTTDVLNVKISRGGETIQDHGLFFRWDWKGRMLKGARSVL